MHVCPNCGYCPCCGRVNPATMPRSPRPWRPSFPPITTPPNYTPQPWSPGYYRNIC